MFRKISENAESDSEGKNSQFCKKISEKTLFFDCIKNWRYFWTNLGPSIIFYGGFKTFIEMIYEKQFLGRYFFTL